MCLLERTPPPGQHICPLGQISCPKARDFFILLPQVYKFKAIWFVPWQSKIYKIDKKTNFYILSLSIQRRYLCKSLNARLLLNPLFDPLFPYLTLVRNRFLGLTHVHVPQRFTLIHVILIVKKKLLIYYVVTTACNVCLVQYYYNDWHIVISPVQKQRAMTRIRKLPKGATPPGVGDI